MKKNPEFRKAHAQKMLEWQKENPELAYHFRKNNVKKATQARKRPVQCVETGEVFESASEAGRQK